jgi:hypothetical protein
MSKPEETELSPERQMALLYLHSDHKSQTVYKYMLANSTARHSQRDIRDLEILGYANWHGITYLTQRGLWAAAKVALALAGRFHIRVP